MGAEYVDDVPYVRHFIGDLSPARLRLAAALNGVSPPPDDDFDYCELGCGHGDTLAALAAAYPGARFLGIDLSAAHVKSAKKAARDAALENIAILERDFSALARDDVGTFDYVVAHGVLSWVSPEKRKALIELAAAILKPGGLLFVSYNALPGWASVEPLRQLILFGGGPSGTSLERARRGVELALAMKAVGAEYFARNPTASKMLDTMTAVGLTYVAHEYLDEHWVPMYFARVATDMAACDLHFAGSLPFHLNFPGTAISEAHEKLLGQVTDRVTFESLKDFAVCEQFRRDLYVKGAVPRSDATRDLYLDTVAWAATASDVPAERVVRLPHRTLSLEGAAFDVLFAALAEGASALPEIARRSEARGVGLEELRASVVRLAIAGHVIPVRGPTRAAIVGEDDVFSVPSVYNQTMLRRLGSETPLVLVSPLAGTAFPISTLEGLALRIVSEVAPNERAKWIYDHVARSTLRIRVGDRVLEDEGDLRTAIQGAVAELHSRRLAKLLELGVVVRQAPG